MYKIIWWYYRYGRFYDRQFTPAVVGDGVTNALEEIVEAINARADAIREEDTEENKNAEKAKNNSD